MSNLFTNLFLRNGAISSPAILQPRLPSLFESSNQADGISETISPPAVTGSFSASREAADNRNGFDPTENAPFPKNIDSAEEPSTISTSLNRSRGDHPREGQNLNSVFDKQENALSKLTRASNENPIDDQTVLDINRRRAETVSSREEHTLELQPQIDDQGSSEKSIRRVVHPRVEPLKPAQLEARKSENKPAGIMSKLGTPSNILHPGDTALGAEPPVVRIHIGRIEVRAILPPAAQPTVKAAPAQPRMTLDEYLRQREGRR
jgi:hypothetical protein